MLPSVWDAVVEPGWEASMHMWPMNQDRIEEKRARFDGRNLIDSERVRKLEPRRNDERRNGDSDDEIISVIDNQQGWRRPTGSRRTGRRCGYDNDDGIVRIEERRTRPTERKMDWSADSEIIEVHEERARPTRLGMDWPSHKPKRPATFIEGIEGSDISIAPPKEGQSGT